MAIETQDVRGPSGVRLTPQVSLDDPSVNADAFLKKAGDWAFNNYFLSTLNPVEEIAGHRPLQPVDAQVMHYINSQLPASNRLPSGHLYSAALVSIVDEMGSLMGAGQLAESTLVEAMIVLEADTQLRDYMTARQLEYYYF